MVNRKGVKARRGIKLKHSPKTKINLYQVGGKNKIMIKEWSAASNLEPQSSHQHHHPTSLSPLGTGSAGRYNLRTHPYQSSTPSLTCSPHIHISPHMSRAVLFILIALVALSFAPRVAAFGAGTCTNPSSPSSSGLIKLNRWLTPQETSLPTPISRIKRTDMVTSKTSSQRSSRPPVGGSCPEAASLLHLMSSASTLATGP